MSILLEPMRSFNLDRDQDYLIILRLLKVKDYSEARKICKRGIKRYSNDKPDYATIQSYSAFNILVLYESGEIEKARELGEEYIKTCIFDDYFLLVYPCLDRDWFSIIGKWMLLENDATKGKSNYLELCGAIKAYTKNKSESDLMLYKSLYIKYPKEFLPDYLLSLIEICEYEVAHKVLMTSNVQFSSSFGYILDYLYHGCFSIEKYDLCLDLSITILKKLTVLDKLARYKDVIKYGLDSIIEVNSEWDYYNDDDEFVSQIFNREIFSLVINAYKQLNYDSKVVTKLCKKILYNRALTHTESDIYILINTYRNYRLNIKE